jgi:hypothetical protein
MTKTHMHKILDFPGKDPYCLDCGATGDNLATSPNDLGAFLIGALTVEWNRSDARPDPGELAADLISDGWVRDVAETDLVTPEDRLTDMIVEWNRSDAHPDPGELAADLISDGWVRDVAGGDDFQIVEDE